MNADSPELLVGLIIGGLIAGAVCGVLPLCVAFKRKRTDLALGGMATCLVAGAIGGLCLAIPAALIFTAVIYSLTKTKLEPDARYGLDDDEWRPWHADIDAPVAESTAPDRPASEHVTATAAVRPLPPVRPATRSPVRAVENGFGCPHCGRAILPDGDRMPPWCPKCGMDLKFNSPKPTPTDEPAPATSVTADPPQ